MKKKLCIAALAVLTGMTAVLSGCGIIHINIGQDYAPDTTDANTVGEVFGKADNTVYISENGEYVPYIVISDNYGGQVLLLRERLLDILMPYSDDPNCNSNGSMSSYYPDNAIDKYLNNDFLSAFSEDIRENINETPVKVASYEAIYNADALAEPETINRKIFILSYSEVINSGTLLSAKEGEFLDYFGAEEHVVAYKSDGNSEGYWLRSAYLWNDNLACGVGFQGAYGSSLTGTEMGIRPAFTVSPQLEVSYRDDIIDGRRICVLE